MYKSRLDDFMVSILSDKEDLAVLYEVIQMVLILSHGNAQVESGFSINGDILSENLQEESGGSKTGLRWDSKSRWSSEC